VTIDEETVRSAIVVVGLGTYIILLVYLAILNIIDPGGGE